MQNVCPPSSRPSSIKIKVQNGTSGLTSAVYLLCPISNLSHMRQSSRNSNI